MDFNAIRVLVTIICCIFLSVVWYYVQKYRKWTTILNKIPGPKPWPLFGNAITFIGPREEISKKAFEVIAPFSKSGDLMLFWMGLIPQVHLLKAKAAKVLLSSTTNINKASIYGYLHKWIGTGLLTSTGTKWQQRRKLITPSFHFRILDNFLQVMNEQADILVELLQQQCNGKKISDEFNIYSYITRCTLDIICETAMGKGVNAQRNVDSDYVNAVYNLTQLITKRMMSPWLAQEWIFQLSPSGRLQKRCLQIVHKFTNKIIKMKRAELEKSQRINTRKAEENDEFGMGIKRRIALLDLLLENSLQETNNSLKLSDDDIREEVDTFMFEGHDTTSVGISWSLYLIGQHPDIQQQILNEIITVLGKERKPITGDDLHKLKYLECVIKESMRLFPPVPFVGRNLSHDLDICGYTIPKGVTVITAPYWIHRDETVYPDPEKFDPDRFLPENVQSRDPYAYLPFSAGLRNCIGQRFAMMEEKVVLSRIVQNFNVKTVVEEDLLSNVIGELVLRPIRGIRVQLELRD
ncbi:hypothetical protein CHUAL_008367 [Chamberlinius hualienensis]|uniref:Cytochrome P450 4GL3 n=1 Tax=Chamberlinius hualienensis TaxID=1551368 RepID=A0A1J1E1K6_9MYRI|nr:cytochrome P450 4GL3 [Chamberlinius hualienensis]